MVVLISAALLESARKLCAEEKITRRVAVLTCGPEAMVSEVDDYFR
jgi:hypothetical protein